MAEGTCLAVDWPTQNGGYSYTDHYDRTEECSAIAFYIRHHASSGSRDTWLTRFENDQILVNGNAAGPDTVLRRGDVLQYHRPPWSEPDAPNTLPILYEDQHMIAVNKPSGLQVMAGGPFFERCAMTILKQHSISGASSKEQQPAPVPVHRLGRGTSGVLLCAITPEARRSLTAQFTAKTAAAGSGAGPAAMAKSYRALVAGVVQQDQGIVDTPIGQVPYPGLATGLFAATPSGKPALSHYKVLHRDSARGCTIVEVEIHTGRPHQVRIHMACLGHPLLGDPLYAPGGGPRQLEQQAAGGVAGTASAIMPGDCGYLLHSLELSCVHPGSGQVVCVTAPPPAELRVPGETW